VSDVAATAAELERFVYDEARLIDEKRFDEWYELFTHDARYWMPLTRGQPDGENHTSLFYEDKLLLKVRIERLKNPRSFSQHQPSWCQHVLQRPVIEEGDAETGRYRLRTPFVYVESRLDSQLVLAGVVSHRLRRESSALRIELKKVELTNCDAALPSIQLFP
jgi:3-phenylpropionate/cinnamic acid dioxygenase small subunit